MLTRMPMGAKVSTSALYQAMVAALGRALYKYALVWADDIIIFSANIEDHIRHVKNVLTRLDKNGFCIAKDKVELGKKEVKWLGYIISERGVRPDDEKIQKLVTMRRPQNVKELRSALGMWTYLASFIPRYAIIAAPLTQLLHKDNNRRKFSQHCPPHRVYKGQTFEPGIPEKQYSNNCFTVFTKTSSVHYSFSLFLTFSP